MASDTTDGATNITGNPAEDRAEHQKSGADRLAPNLSATEGSEPAPPAAMANEGSAPATGEQEPPAASQRAELTACIAALRAENDRLRTELNTMRSRAERRNGPHRTRHAVVTALVVLSCLSLLVSTVTIWAQQTFLSNTDRWVAIVGPIAQDPTAITALSAYAADQTVMLLKVQQRTQNVLPSQADFLAAPLTNVVRNFVQARLADAMRTGRFQQAWVTVNTVVHTEIVEALRGQSNTLTISNGTLTLDLIPIITEGLQVVRDNISGLLPPQVHLPNPNTQSVQQAIQQLSQALGVKLPSGFGQVELVQSDQLTTAQQWVKLLDVFSSLLPLLTIVLFIAALWLSLNRRRTVLQLGIGIAIAFLVAKIAIAVLQDMVASAISNPTASSVLQPAIERALSYIVTSTTWILLIGVVSALVAFLVGRPEWFKAGYAQACLAFGWMKKQARNFRLAVHQR
jgi:hypothetical protein